MCSSGLDCSCVGSKSVDIFALRILDGDSAHEQAHNTFSSVGDSSQNSSEVEGFIESSSDGGHSWGCTARHQDSNNWSSHSQTWVRSQRLKRLKTQFAGNGQALHMRKSGWPHGQRAQIRIQSLRLGSSTQLITSASRAINRKNHVREQSASHAALRGRKYHYLASHSHVGEQRFGKLQKPLRDFRWAVSRATF